MKENETKTNAEKVREAMGKEQVAENPFVTSDSFVGLMRVIALLSRTVIQQTTHSGEAVNATMSVVVTYLKNIPDDLWALMSKAVSERGNERAKDLFTHLNAARDYQGKNHAEFETDFEPFPEFNVKPPTRSC